MAIDSFMAFKQYQATAVGPQWLDAESQVDLSKNSGEELAKDLVVGKVFEVESYSFGVEQVLNIGSQSSGAGAGKVTFNPFSIERKIDKASPTFFMMSCSGQAFERVVLAMRKSSGGEATGKFFLRFDFKLVAVKTISWEHDEESPKESIEFEYGALFVRYGQQDASGKIPSIITKGWNRVTNVQDANLDSPVGRNV
jgi:type VI secretion system secreted protein Hcp